MVGYVQLWANVVMIELVYFGGCPHVDDARSNLARALGVTDGPVPWTEWDLDHPSTRVGSEVIRPRQCLWRVDMCSGSRKEQSSPDHVGQVALLR